MKIREGYNPSLGAMKIISWNVRGVNAPDKWCLIKCQIDQSNIDILLLQETKMNGEEGGKRIKY